jgi:uncharacterized protein (UPF0276 family)
MLQATLPLFERGEVEAIEWSFDALYKFPVIPDWFTELITAFSQEQRLIGHGVFFSLFSGKWSPEQEQWLAQLSELCSRFQFDHITEHFGFMTGKDFHTGAPLGIPYTPATLALGQDRLQRISRAGGCPVGLENLAFAYSVEEVRVHGQFLRELIEPVNGFIILDLHNLYCQLHNFSRNYEELIVLYPLDRVREVHISGGSWEPSTLQAGKKVRRDTHDESVPEEVFRLLERTIPKCPNLKFVVMEQLGVGLQTTESRSGFQRDFLRMKEIVKAAEPPTDKQANEFLPPTTMPSTPPFEDQKLHDQQRLLAQILETAADPADARQRLLASALADTAWNVEHWQSDMLETAVRIAQKWRKGFK